MNEWNERTLIDERRKFIEARADRTSILGVSIIFTATLAFAWLVSFALLKQGILRMPLRYAISFCAAYFVFFWSVRIWADFQRKHPQDRAQSNGSIDFPIVDAGGEGCLIALGVFLVSGLLSCALWAFGGFPILLEAAFEVAFAGTVVRSAFRKNQSVGDWHITLLKRTWVPALTLLLMTGGIAHYLQLRAPQATKLSDAIPFIWKSKP